MRPPCAVAAMLRSGGPVRVPLRRCCVAALLGRKTERPPECHAPEAGR